MSDDDSPPGVRYSASGRELHLPVSRPAEQDGDVFVDLSGTVANLKARMEKVKAKGKKILIFIRAPVASGKTTLVNYLTTVHSNEFVRVSTATSEVGWYSSVIKASGLDPATSDVEDALQAIATTGKTIVIDEAHCMFSERNVVATFFKHSELYKPAPSYLLFSASGSGVNRDDTTVTTLGEIEDKFLWYPPVPVAEQLREQLAEAKQPVLLDVESVKFFVRLCGSHRGILMRALEWVQECQHDDERGDNITAWTIRDTVSKVRRTFEDSKRQKGIWKSGLLNNLKKSRAVRVNGKFSDVGNIPKEFGFVLFGGPKVRTELNFRERELTINGFLFPQRGGDIDGELVGFDWEDPDVLYGIPNPIMASYYGDLLPREPGTCERQLIEDKKKANSAADLLARVLPYMTFTAVVENPINRGDGEKLSDSLSTSGLPFEDDYNNAITAILRYELKYSVANPQSVKDGKTDIVVNYDDGMTCAIESIMEKQSPGEHRNHAERFLKPDKLNYAEAHQKALLIIGDDRERVKNRVNHVAKEMEGKVGAPEVIGLCVSLNHDIYEMYLQEETEPLFFVCDRVAKCLTKDDRERFETAQVCSSEYEKAQKKPRAK